jgi:hypothetical protein
MDLHDWEAAPSPRSSTPQSTPGNYLMQDVEVHVLFLNGVRGFQLLFKSGAVIWREPCPECWFSYVHCRPIISPIVSSQE